MKSFWQFFQENVYRMDFLPNQRNRGLDALYRKRKLTMTSTRPEKLSSIGNDNKRKYTIAGKSQIPNTGPQKDLSKFIQKSKEKVHSSLANWHRNHVKVSDGSSVTTTDAYESYLNHADKHGYEPIPLPSFMHQWKGISDHHIARIAGRVRHIGIKLV